MTTPVGSWRDRSIHASWRWYGRLVRTLTPGGPSREFAAHGYVVGLLPPALVESAAGMVRSSPRIEMRPGDSLPGYRSSEKVYKVAGTLNAGHRYFRPEPSGQGPLVALLAALGPPVREALGTEWRIVNTRILETLPDAAIMGPNAWHGDGFPPDLLKVMLYLSPAGPDCGTTEFQLDGGRTSVIEGPPGTWVLFRNSTLIHRGVPPRTGTRLAVEITLMPAWRRSTEPVFAGLNATYPDYPWSVTSLGRALAGPPGRVAAPATEVVPAPATDKEGRAREKAARGAAKAAAAAAKQAQAEAELHRRRRHQRRARLVNAILPARAVNIGGGSEFAHPRWLNLDGATGPANPRPFAFTPSCVFPARTGSLATVYSSHCLEHLDDATVSRVLAEARRVIRPDGRLVIKLPDFDRALACWRAGDAAFFDEDRWGLRRLKELWSVKHVADTLDARASMVFCGFWNDEYGNHFGDRASREGAYHGPAPIEGATLRALVAGSSPHALAGAMRAHVVATEPSYHFNHQNAWSRDELRASLDAAGFEVVSFDEATVISAAADIPGIEAARDESMYFLARPKGQGTPCSSPS